MELVITTLIWAAVIQGLLLGMAFIAARKRQSFANRLLGFFLISFVFQALSDLLPFNEIGSYSLSGYFTLPEVKWLLPVLFLHYVLVKVGRSSAYRWFLYFHYGLAFSLISLTLINVLLVIIKGLTLMDVFSWQLLENFYMTLQYYAFLLTVVSFGLALRETWRYRQLVRNEYSDLVMMDINWLWQFIFVIAPIIVFWGAELLRIARGGMGQSELTIVAFIFISVFNYFVSFKAFTQQTLFDRPADAEKAAASEPVISNESKPAVDSEIGDQIVAAMVEHAYFLNQNLTLHDFAREIDVSPRIISTYLNQTLESNFNEWVNNFRVDHAMASLQDKGKEHYSIEGIGADAGFKSRSAMYMAFKKKTGHTPGHFKKELMS